jgi:drug/metabolite transporter (DMT)-like permease
MTDTRDSEKSASAKGYWFIVGATVLWGTSATLARYVFRDRHVPPMTAVELRLTLSAILLGLWLRWRERSRATGARGASGVDVENDPSSRRDPPSMRIARADIGYFVVLGIFGLAAVQGSYYYSISVLGVGLPILIQYLAPSMIVALDLLRGRRVSALTMIAVVAALTGTALLVGNLDPAARHVRPFQWVVCFGAAVTFTFFIVYSKRGLARYAPEVVLFYTLCVAGIFWAIVTPPWKILGAGYGPDLWALFVLLAISSTLAPFALFYAGLRRLTPTRVGVISTLEPVVAVVSAALFLGEALRPIQNLGALLVLVAAAISSREPVEAARV